MLELAPRQFSALSVLARGRAGNAKLSDYKTITKTLSGDALLAAKMMYNEPVPGKFLGREAEVRELVDHLTQWAQKLPRRA